MFFKILSSIFDKYKLLRLSSLSARWSNFAGFVCPLLHLAPWPCTFAGRKGYTFSMFIQIYTSLQLQYKSGKMMSAAVLYCTVFPPYIVFCISDTCRLKLIKINHNRTKSTIKINCVIDFYRFLIFFDWLVSTTIDNDRFLSTIEIIDMLRPGKKCTCNFILPEST